MLYWSIFFGVPLAALLGGSVLLCLRWRLESYHFRAVTALLMAAAPVVLGSCALAYVTFVTPIAKSNYTVETTGFLLAAIAIAATAPTRRCIQRWILFSTLSVSVFMFVLFFMMVCTY